MVSPRIPDQRIAARLAIIYPIRPVFDGTGRTHKGDKIVLASTILAYLVLSFGAALIFFYAVDIAGRTVDNRQKPEEFPAPKCDADAPVLSHKS